MCKIKHRMSNNCQIIRICQACPGYAPRPHFGGFAPPPYPPRAMPLDRAGGLQSCIRTPSYSLWIRLCLGANLVIYSDIPVIVNCLFSKWLLVVPLCMLSVAAQYKMHTERLITVSVPSGQINSHGISDDDSHNILHVHISLRACQWLSNVYQLQSRVCTPGIPVSSSPLLLLCPSHASHTVVHQCRELVTWPKCTRPTLTLTHTKVTVYLYSALGVSAIMHYINIRFTYLPPDLLIYLLTYHCPAAAAWPWVAGETLGGRHLVNTGVLSLKLQYTEVGLDQAWFTNCSVWLCFPFNALILLVGDSHHGQQ